MKKIVVLLAVLALAAPLFAQDVKINLSTRVEAGPRYWVDVKYDATAAGQLVRGFSFDMEVDNGASILTIDGYKGQGDPTDVMSSSDPGKTLGYGIYLGTMVIDVTTDPLNPVVTAEGSPVANGPDSLSGGLVGAGIPGITIECGSLYDPTIPADAPLATGTLFSVEVDKLITAMTLEADEDTRGGIVLEDGTVANLVSPTFMVAWGTTTQCNGDADGNKIVNVDDWPAFKLAFGKSYPHAAYNATADFNRDGTINVDDWPQFKLNFGKVPATNCTFGMYGETWPPL